MNTSPKNFAAIYVWNRGRWLYVGTILIVVSSLVSFAAEQPEKPPAGPFGYTLLRTADDEPADIDFFFLNPDCATCHPRQLAEVQGSMHSAAHTDPLYRSLAEIAREEAGETMYTFCSGCHSPAGVASALIPSKPEERLPREAKAGVTCDVCHQVSALTGDEGPWNEPGNASFVLKTGRVKYGHSGIVAENRLHTGEKRDYYRKSEFCASCHTVIHPVNGLRIEHTYGEWKSSIYAEKGIQCQDCHMRSVEDAVKVAETLKPVVVKGRLVLDGDEREIFPHHFVGANANADLLAGGKEHARMAEQRLKTAARLELQAPAKAASGDELAVNVMVHNVAAGHNLPTGVTELRQMWVELIARQSNGDVIWRHGGLDDKGEILPGTIRFGAEAVGEDGEITHKLWEMKRILWKRTIPPKGESRDTVRIKLPPGLSGKAVIGARLRYRSAAPGVVREIMQEDAFTPKIVEMATARTTVEIE